jgi:histone deacetylase 11
LVDGLELSAFDAMDLSAFLIFDPAYQTDLVGYGMNRPFALDRGKLVLARLEEHLGEPVQFRLPVPLERQALQLVHSEAYIRSLSSSLTWTDIFELDETLDENGHLPGARFPLHHIISDFLLKAGGTVEAAFACLESGFCANLGAGYHHAKPDQGQGFCAINDVALAARSLLRDDRCKVRKLMIVDVDFHQGDGTVLCLQEEMKAGRVFTYSIHSHEGWPDEKVHSSLDVAIKEAEQGRYLEMLAATLPQSISDFAPDCILLVDGSDAYEKDVLPGTKFIKLPLPVMQERSRFLSDLFFRHSLPVSLVFAGGYGPDVWEAHYATVQAMLARYAGLTSLAL